MTLGSIIRAALLGAALLWPSADAFALRILLTNDDGVDAPGLVTLREALVAAGHDVTTVAPDREMSGKSGSMTVRGVMAVEKRDGQVYALAGTPSDCVHVGLGLIMQEKPDLVISGTNFGQNAASGLHISATFGAALAAHALGVPAIAVSQTFDTANRANTAAYFGDAAETIVQVLALLTRDGRPLPSGMLLNINQPLRHTAQVTAWRITRPSPVSGLDFAYSWEPDGTAVKVGLLVRKVTAPSGTDEAAIADGAVSISPLNDEFGTDAELGTWLGNEIAARGRAPAEAGR